MTVMPLLATLAGEAVGQVAPSAGAGPSLQTPSDADWESARPDSVGVDISGGAQTNVVAGRVTTLEHGQNPDAIAEIRVIDGPDHGNLTVNPDNSMALVLTESDHTGPLSFSYEVTFTDGSTKTFTETVKVNPGTQEAGWGAGDHYMLETDENGDVVVEHGDNHREVYVSGSEDALSLSDIAALEGLDVKQITGKWLANHPEYGGSEDMALKADAGMKLWKEMTGREADPSSHSLLFERGYSYECNNFLSNGMEGESALNPIHIGAWGEGERPEILDEIKLTKDGGQNVVIQDLHFSGGITILSGSNILLDDILSTDREINIQNVDNFTLRNSDVFDALSHRADESDGDGSAHSLRSSGIFVADTSGILLEGNNFDHNGWEADYLEPDGGIAPSKYSHNVYLQYNNEDVTFRDNIILRSGGTGAQLRSGGFIEDNIFIDNNGGFFVGSGGTNADGSVGFGNYALLNGNIVTSAGHRISDDGQGSLSSGITNNSFDSSLIGNIVAHLANPNDPSELEWKTVTHRALTLRDGTPFFNDTIIYNWVAGRAAASQITEQNAEGLNEGVLDQTTIQLFTAQLLGNPNATIADLADFLRAQADALPADLREQAQEILDNSVDADLIIAFFRDGFGVNVDIRDTAETLTFTPHEAGDGIRWDNRINWSTGDLPNTQDGDSVDLNGNWVRYGSNTTELDNLDFGETAGRLLVTGGKLSVDGEIAVGDNGAQLTIDAAGQFWTDGYSDSDALLIDINGGRFANTGDFKGAVRMFVGDDGQAILASDDSVFHLDRGSRLTIEDEDAEVGFDGDQGGMAILRMERGSAIDFRAEDGAFGTIGEFSSGAYQGDDPDVTSGINLGNGALCLNLRTMGPEASEWTLMEADQLIGSFRAIHARHLGTGRDLEIVIDHDTDKVILKLGAAGAGSGKVTMTKVGDPADFVSEDDQASQDLWEALTAGQGVISDDPIQDTADDTEPSWLLA